MILFSQQLISKSFPQRVTWVRRFFFLAAIIVLIRAFYLQVIERPVWELLAERQHSQFRSVKIQRGAIYDRDGNILAVSLPMDSWFAIPTEVENPADTAQKLGSILSLDREKLLKKLTAKVSFTWLKRNTKPRASESIHRLRLPGVHRLKEYQRFYPSGSLAAQLIGFSGIDSQGLEGLEFQYNSHLMDLRNRQLGWGDAYKRSNAKRFSGGSLDLTINSEIQYLVEIELNKALSKMRAKSGIAIVMESQTGAILAIASLPDFDPNNFDRYDRSNFFNRVVGSVYEPGSTFKIITIASALENEIIRENDIFFCENGAYQIQDRTIHDIGSYEWLSLEKIVQKSSNICAAKIGQMIPRSVFYRMIKDFGFGRKTGVGLPGEVKGRVFDFRKWSETDVATISFGHSISVTPIQLISGINTIANGGELVAPYVVRQAKKANGELMPLNRPKPQRILKRETAEIMKKFMMSVTRKGGTGYSARITGITVAGKTGTSEKFNPKTGEYSSDSHLSSFIGFFPADKPDTTILVVIDDPKASYLGQKNAVIVFKKIAEKVTQHQEERWLRDYLKNPGSGVKIFNGINLSAESFKKKRQSIDQLSDRLKNKTMREVLVVASQEGLNIKIKGSGRLKRLINIPGQANHFIAELQ